MQTECPRKVWESKQEPSWCEVTMLTTTPPLELISSAALHAARPEQPWHDSLKITLRPKPLSAVLHNTYLMTGQKSKHVCLSVSVCLCRCLCSAFLNIIISSIWCRSMCHFLAMTEASIDSFGYCFWVIIYFLFPIERVSTLVLHLLLRVLRPEQTCCGKALANLPEQWKDETLLCV